MANITYDFIDSPSGSSDGYRNSVGFFSLKNDGDDALVRILHNGVEDFDMLSCHTVEVDGKFRKINCLRSPRDPINKCPLCEAGVGKLQQKMFIHLLHYVKDESGNIVVLPKIWERSISYAKTLKGLIDEYGPLESMVFKIRRQGAARSMSTTYTILPQDRSIYTPQQYPIDKSGFEGYSVLGTLVMNKNYDDCVSFVRTGAFPETQKTQPAAPADWGNQPTFEKAQPINTPYQPVDTPYQPMTPYQPTTTNQPVYEPYAPSQTVSNPVPPSQQMPWDNNPTGGFQPPRRYN